MNKPGVRKLSKDNFEINITGNRDYRSPDVDISVKINDLDEIEITIPKSMRCYSYMKTIEEQGFTKLIFN